MHSLSTWTQKTTLLIAAAAAITTSTAYAEAVRYYAPGAVPDPQVVAQILGGTAAPAPRMKMRGLSQPAPPPAMSNVDDGGRVMSDALPERTINDSAAAAVQAWQNKLAGNTVQAPAAAPVATNAVIPNGATKAAAVPTAAPAGAAPVALNATPTPSPAATPTALAMAINFANASARIEADARPALDAIAAGIRLAGFDRPIVIEGHTSALGSFAYNMKLSEQRALSVKAYLVQRHGIPAAALKVVPLGPTMPLVNGDPDAPANRRVQFRRIASAT